MPFKEGPNGLTYVPDEDKIRVDTSLMPKARRRKPIPERLWHVSPTGKPIDLSAGSCLRRQLDSLQRIHGSVWVIRNVDWCPGYNPHYNAASDPEGVASIWFTPGDEFEDTP